MAEQSTSTSTDAQSAPTTWAERHAALMARVEAAKLADPEPGKRIERTPGFSRYNLPRSTTKGASSARRRR